MQNHLVKDKITLNRFFYSVVENEICPRTEPMTFIALKKKFLLQHHWLQIMFTFNARCMHIHVIYVMRVF